MKRVLLYTVMATLAMAALIGSYVLLFGNFGKTEGKVLFTTLTISYFSVTSLACAAAYEKKQHPLLSIPGLAVSLLGFLFFAPSIWADWFEIAAIGKAMIVVAVVAFSLAHASLLSLVSLKHRHKWAYFAAVVAILALATIISGIVVFQPSGDWIVRIVGVVAILDGCFSLCVPVLYRLGGKPAMEKPSTGLDRIELVCPRCGEHGILPLGAAKCGKCSLSIRVSVGEESD